ncbi:hypothetical protein CH371_11520 [Leptospira wolffii]|uniref:Lipoprotein n=1 Tax=Leptospira wolffii TaxID=409998 RepID=A0A2M9ZAU5_9LEPT|nr:hypothetical protein [Leptospira wolffii]PJZ65561.1 hypothetical protein CH371_11520 [Leptospira wolffii]
MNRSIKKMGYFLGLATLGFFTLNCPKSSSGNSGAALLALLGGSQPGVYISGTLVDNTGAPLVGATVEILGRGESSTVVLPPNWVGNSSGSATRTANKYFMTSVSNSIPNNAIPAGFLYNNSNGSAATAGNGSACDSFDGTAKVNNSPTDAASDGIPDCPATYIAKASTVFANSGNTAGVNFVKAQCGQATIDQINGWTESTGTQPGRFLDGTNSVTGPHIDDGSTGGDGYKLGPIPVAYDKGIVRIYCDVSTLEAGAIGAGINTSVQADGTAIATFVTGAGGAFSGKFNVSSVGNTYNVRVTPSGGGSPLKTRRLKIAKNGVATLLSPVSEKLGNAPLELRSGKDITDQESSWNSIYSSGNNTDDRGHYDFSFGSVTINMIYPKNGTQISGTLSSNLHLTKAGSPYVLSGTVIVPSGITLTIDAGVVVYGAVAPAGALLIKPGGKISANGTAAEPILFTSSKDAGSRAPADWQGIIIQGNAVQTFGGYGQTAIGEGDTGSFGGNNNADNSGNLTYVVVQFAGAPFSPGNERNCVSLMGVGSGTTLDYVQCHRGFDDGFEQWGGAFTAKHMISTGNRDDQFDFADGFIGKYQYGISHLYRAAIAVNDDTSRCIEGDGNSALACSGSARTGGTCSDPFFANITCVGPGASAPNAGGAIFVRRASGASGDQQGDYSHFIVDNHIGKPALDCQSDSAPSDARVSYVSIKNMGSNAATNTFKGACNSGTVDIGVVGVGITTIAEDATVNYAPASSATTTGSTALKTANTNFNVSFFDNTTFYGAIQDAASDWTTGWAEYPAN